MANTIERIGDIVRSNANELLDRLEDPEKLARQLLRDMELAVEQAVESVSRAIADKGRIDREYESARLRVESYGEKARRAFEKGDEDLTRKALELKVHYDVAANDARAAAEEGGQAVAQLREELKTARDGQGRLIAGIQVNAAGSSPQSADQFSDVQRLQGRLERNRSELERLRMQLQRDDDAPVTDVGTESDSDSLERRFANLEVDEKVEKEMEVLRQKANPE